ncbi:unnamed protein product [marine sediment metagenome]|uniref:Uncharacterized protein n=1 Tax=marine sediment metagenome TaxID=412755 RepID=X1DPL0_9ZZZZ
MAITRSQYVRELEGRMAKGKPFDKAHKKAVKKAVARPTKGRYDEKFVKRVARKLYEVFYGPRAYSKKKFRPSKKKEIRRTRLSRQSKKQLSYLSDRDYKETMKALKGK